MAKDPSETKRAEDSKITGYDRNGKARTWRADELRGGRLPEGYTDEPPKGTHPNDPDFGKPKEADAGNAPLQPGAGGKNK